MIFTTVTVIFLPLSVVASVFGMNTADMRNMESGQWAFWAAALPFTAFVVLITAWYTELLPTKKALFESKLWKNEVNDVGSEDSRLGQARRSQSV